MSLMKTFHLLRDVSSIRLSVFDPAFFQLIFSLKGQAEPNIFRNKLVQVDAYKITIPMYFSLNLII